MDACHIPHFMPELQTSISLATTKMWSFWWNIKNNIQYHFKQQYKTSHNLLALSATT